MGRPRRQPPFSGRDRFGGARHRFGSGEAEEPRSVPVTAGYRPRDLGEAGICLALPGEALLQRHYAVEAAIPFANQDGTGFDSPLAWRAISSRLTDPARAPSTETLERPANSVGEIPECIRLQSVGENTRQKRPRQVHGSGPAEDVSPLQAKASQIERREIGDRLS